MLSKKVRQSVLSLCPHSVLRMMAAFVRLAGDLPFTQKTFFRNLVAVAVAAVVLCREKVGFKVGKGQPAAAHHTRNLRHTRHFLQLLRD